MPAKRKIIDHDKAIADLGELKFKKGYGNVSLVKYLNDVYGIGVTRSYELINEMNTKVGEIYKEIYTDQLKDSIFFLEKLREDAIADDNKKLALEIQKELNKINSLGTQKVDVTTNGESINQIVWVETKTYDDKKED